MRFAKSLGASARASGRLTYTLEIGPPGDLAADIVDETAEQRAQHAQLAMNHIAIPNYQPLIWELRLLERQAHRGDLLRIDRRLCFEVEACKSFHPSHTVLLFWRVGRLCGKVPTFRGLARTDSVSGAY